MTDQEREIADLRQAVRGLTICVAELTGRLVQSEALTKDNAWWAVNQASPRIGNDRAIQETWDEVWLRNIG